MKVEDILEHNYLSLGICENFIERILNALYDF